MTTISTEGLRGLNSRQLGVVAGLVEQIDGIRCGSFVLPALIQRQGFDTTPRPKTDVLTALSIVAAKSNSKPKRKGRAFTPEQKLAHRRLMQKAWVARKRKAARAVQSDKVEVPS